MKEAGDNVFLHISRVVGGEMQVTVCVGRFSVNTDVEEFIARVME